MLNRRQFVASAGTLLMASPLLHRSASAAPTERIASVERKLAQMVGKPVSPDFILSSLGQDLKPVEKRIAIFELVRRVPYKLTAWTGDPDSLFSLGRGDCRHKAAAAARLLRKAGFKAEQALVTFDWADLPVPREMFDILTDTRSFHDTVYVSIDGRRTLFDATWDPALRAVGFPILDAWDGSDQTQPITKGEIQLVNLSEIPKNSNMYEHFGFRWPKREKTLAFNRKFNAWTDSIRQTGSASQ